MDSSYVLLEGCRPSKTLEFLATPPQIRKYLDLSGVGILQKKTINKFQGLVKELK